MENASKALIMAATILMSVVIVSLGVYLATALSSYASEVDEQTRINQISQFNSQFLTYLNKEVTIHDIITVANLAKENNDYYGLTSLTSGTSEGKTLYIQVSVQGISSNFENESASFANDTSQMQGQIDSTTGELKKYICEEVSISEYTERVYYISFKEI